MFPRDKYLSQTEVVKQYKISVKAYKQLLVDHQIQVVTKDIIYPDYSLKTVYVLKEDIAILNLQPRLKPAL